MTTRTNRDSREAKVGRQERTNRCEMGYNDNDNNNRVIVLGTTQATQLAALARRQPRVRVWFLKVVGYLSHGEGSDANLRSLSTG